MALKVWLMAELADLDGGRVWAWPAAYDPHAGFCGDPDCGGYLPLPWDKPDRLDLQPAGVDSVADFIRCDFLCIDFRRLRAGIQCKRVYLFSILKGGKGYGFKRSKYE